MSLGRDDGVRYRPQDGTTKDTVTECISLERMSRHIQSRSQQAF